MTTWTRKKLCTLKERIYGITAINHDNTIYMTTVHGGLWRITKDDNIPCNIAQFDGMRGIVWDRNNTLYICTISMSQILSYSIHTGQMVEVTGLKGSPNYYHRLSFCDSWGIASDKNGDIYVTAKNTIMKINHKDSTVTSVIEQPHIFSAVIFEQSVVGWRSLAGIAVDDDGTIYVCDKGNHAVLQVKDGFVTQLACIHGEQQYYGGIIQTSLFGSPSVESLITHQGGVLVADLENIYLVKNNNVSKSVDFTGISKPSCLAKDSAGNIYCGTMDGEVWIFTKNQQTANSNNLVKRENSPSSFHNNDEQLVDQLLRRIDELERQVAELKAQKSSQSPTTDLLQIDYSDLNFDDSKVAFASGGSADVFRAKFAGIYVAVKKFQHNDKAKQKFNSEFEVMKNISHPNIVTLIGKCLDPPCIVMELMDNSLHDIVHSQRPLMPQLKLDIMKQVASGLVFMHNRNIIHCDIKSRNVLIDSTWTVKICDFGISVTPDVQSPHTRTLSWQYMAPEMLEDRPIVVAESDVFSFSILLWEVFSRQEPHKNISSAVIARQIETLRPDIRAIAEEHPRIAKLCEACWSGNFKQRPSMKAVLESLKEASSSLSTLQRGSKLSFRFEDIIRKEDQLEQISLILDGSVSANWRQLGGALGFDVLALNRFENTKTPSPARLLLQSWQHRQNATIEELIKALEKIGQWSVINKLIEWTQYQVL